MSAHQQTAEPLVAGDREQIERDVGDEFSEDPAADSVIEDERADVEGDGSDCEAVDQLRRPELDGHAAQREQVGH